MTRVSPPDDPFVCPRGNASRPSTLMPRCASRAAAALPSAPRPTTMTSLGLGELIEEAPEHLRGLGHEVEAHVLVRCVHPRVWVAVPDGDHRQLLRVAHLLFRPRARPRHCAH